MNSLSGGNPAAVADEVPMDELINMVAQRAGIGPDRTRTPVKTVLGLAKSRLPAPWAGQLGRELAGNGAGAGASAGSGNITKGPGEMFGSK